MVKKTGVFLAYHGAQYDDFLSIDTLKGEEEYGKLIKRLSQFMRNYFSLHDFSCHFTETNDYSFISVFPINNSK